jgi:cytosine/adenosine deaminase-related metal-dependent hydrolase
MSTTNGAQALSKSGDIGALIAGSCADCIAVPYTGPINEARLCEEVLYTGQVREVFIAGEQVRTP